MKKDFYFPLIWVSEDEEGNVVDTNCPALFCKPPQIVKEPSEEPPPEIAKPTSKQLTCKRCDYTWTPRKKQKPVQCPKCRSCYWDKKRVYKNTSK